MDSSAGDDASPDPLPTPEQAHEARRRRDAFAYALVGSTIGYVISCAITPSGAALFAPLVTLFMGSPSVTLIILFEAVLASVATAAGVRFRLIPARPWIVISVAALLSTALISGYVYWLWLSVSDHPSGPLFG
jgi:hypothetical protein